MYSVCHVCIACYLLQYYGYSRTRVWRHIAILILHVVYRYGIPTEYGYSSTSTYTCIEYTRGHVYTCTTRVLEYSNIGNRYLLVPTEYTCTVACNRTSHTSYCNMAYYRNIAHINMANNNYFLFLISVEYTCTCTGTR